MLDKIVLSGTEIENQIFLQENSFFKKNHLFSFEQDLQKYIKQKKTVACLSSGTAAIHLALILAGVKKKR